MKFLSRCAPLAALIGGATCFAQTLPPPPGSPAPVRKLEYDANGNPTRTTLSPGVPGLELSSVSSWDRLDRLSKVTDARNGVVTIDYSGRGDITRVTDPRNLVTDYPRTGLGDVTDLISPDTGKASHTYDDAGNLKTRTDSRGVRATHIYDALNRLTSTVFSQTGQASLTYTWTYDQAGAGFSNGAGRLTSTRSPFSSTQYTYDAEGRVLTDTQRFDAATGANAAQVTRVVTYTYDAGGNITSIVYPSGRRLVITYSGGMPSTLALASSATAAPATLLSAIQWEPFGGVRSWLWQQGTTTRLHDRQFDTYGRLVRYRIGPWVRDLTYDTADRITGFRHFLAANAAAQPSLDQSFGYDGLGRVVSVVSASSSWSITYDANGNRTGVTLNGAPSAYTVAPTSNRLTSVSNPTRNFVYDSAGNTTSAGSYTATYNLAGRLSTLNRAGVTTTYAVDGFGRRVRKFDSRGATNTVLFVYDQQGQLLGEYSNTGAPIREYVWLGSTPVAMFIPNPAGATLQPIAYYVHTDHLDTPRALLDTAGNLRWTWLAEPFGNTAPNANPAGLGAVTMNLRHPGQYADAESGLFYNYFRDYDPSLGRYTQSDPIGLAGGINTYAYVEGNPVSKVDPLGLETYLCQRPLDGFRGVSVGPLYHQFLCTLDAKGKVNCGGLGPRDGSSGMFGGPGVIEPESSVRPEQCEKVRDLDQCFEKCVNDSLASPAPNYDVRAGRSWLFPSSNTQQCQVYAKSVLDRCSAQCRK